MSWVSQHRFIVALAVVLVILVVANLWLFAPRFFLNKQLLTEAKLSEQLTLLSDYAKEGGEVLQVVSNDGPSEARKADLAAVQQQVDDVVIVMHYAPYEVTMQPDIDEALHLAEVISFTLRDGAFDLDDKLKMAKTAQVLSRASLQAKQLAAE